MCCMSVIKQGEHIPLKRYEMSALLDHYFAVTVYSGNFYIV